MPTGYTYSIEKGISFNDFVLSCARAFGACVTMREDSMDKKIPIFKVSDYHKDEIKKFKERLGKLLLMKLEECEKGAEEECKRELKEEMECINKDEMSRMKYEDMLKKVKEWKPPTREHDGLRDFMIQQINGSIDFDCNIKYAQERLDNVRKLSGEEWIKGKIEKCKQDIWYHEKELQEETKRIEGRNLWIRQLKESLK